MSEGSNEPEDPKTKQEEMEMIFGKDIELSNEKLEEEKKEEKEEEEGGEEGGEEEQADRFYCIFSYIRDK